MAFLDDILPPTLDPMLKLLIDILIGLHLIIFLVFVILLYRNIRSKEHIGKQ